MGSLGYRWFLPVLLLLGLVAGAWACPTCVAGMDQEQASAVTNGYLLSYAFIACCPVVIVGTVAYNIASALSDDLEATQQPSRV